MAKHFLRAACCAIALYPTGVIANCKIVPAPAAALAVDGFYSDRAGTVVDPSRRAARDKAVEIYEQVVRQVQHDADAFAADKSLDAGACALRQLTAWADARPLTGGLQGQQAEYERNWYLAGFALAYLKVKIRADSQQQALIERWLHDMANGTGEALTRGKIPSNNLTYWAGLALASAGLATGKAALLDRAHAILLEGLSSVSPTGMLAQELKRGARALDYHAFAAGPLVLLAYISELRGKPYDKAALARLVDAVIAGIANPRQFAARAGKAQDQPAQWNLAWVAIYRRMAPGKPLPEISDANHFLGGNVEATREAIRHTAAR